MLGFPFGRPLSQAKDALDTLVHCNDKLHALEKAAEEGLPSQAVMRLVANCVSRQPNFWLRCLSLLGTDCFQHEQEFKTTVVLSGDFLYAMEG